MRPGRRRSGDRHRDPEEPETAAERAEGEVGEIWVAGPERGPRLLGAAGALGRGRSGAPARRPDRDAGFLRTGDLGFLHGGELFVTGRLKDLIVVRGRNVYPQDLELTACESHPVLRGGIGAAFAVETAAGEAVALVLEAGARRRADGEEALAAVRQAIAEEHEVPVQAVVLVGPGGVPKTTSGKVQRQLCRRLFLDGGCIRWPSGGPAGIAGVRTRSEGRRGPEPLAAWLRRRAAARLGVGEEEIDPAGRSPATASTRWPPWSWPTRSRPSWGWSSPSPPCWRAPDWPISPPGWRRSSPPAARGTAAAGRGRGGRSLRGERALWFLQQLDAASPAYHLAGAARLAGEVDEEALRLCVHGTGRPPPRPAHHLRGPRRRAPAARSIPWRSSTSGSWTRPGGARTS